ncbi:MAG TPA: hypothetical protein DCE42_19880 [Myxococcales bacterium]|nr:hypothetical protein [Deltaproteobacteria bacterium]MBU52881.1 hypothetical protein [Deltaproteobacteria bacterium]HAA57036.1 hypothetical protein [Myxococcales bacterium]|tara:strand:- start:18904 stop:20070 length:1167 start_codon:yes stop_codon:yes gene_type:complete
MSQRYFATVAPGLETQLLEELRLFRIKKPKVYTGGVEFSATRRGLYQVLQGCATATRLLLRVDHFQATSVQELFRKTRRINFSRILPAGTVLHIKATNKRSFAGGTGELTRFVLDGIQAHYKERALTPPTSTDDASEADQRLLIRLEDNQCTLSLDTSGEMMFRRGWREHAGKAPLRENIARALLMAIGWEPGVPLIDPMCGAGTFLIEAARWTQQQPPRLWEHYACHNWNNFDEALWKEIAAKSTALPPQKAGLLLGRDMNAHAVEIAEKNAALAGVQELISWEKAEAQSVTFPEESGVVIVNPPYGSRLERKQQKGNAPDQQLLRRFAKDGQGWTLGLLLPGELKVVYGGLRCEVISRFRNGGIPVAFWRITHEGTKTSSLPTTKG